MKKKKITISEIFFTFDGITFANVLMSIELLQNVISFHTVIMKTFGANTLIITIQLAFLRNLPFILLDDNQPCILDITVNEKT